jgi:hypothetical protein
MTVLALLDHLLSSAVFFSTKEPPVTVVDNVNQHKMHECYLTWVEHPIPYGFWYRITLHMSVIYMQIVKLIVKYQNKFKEGGTRDISHILMFYWFEAVLYLDPVSKFPETTERRG